MQNSVDVDQSWMEEYPKDVLRLFYLQPNLDSSSIEMLLQQCQQQYCAIQELCGMIVSYLEDFTPDSHEGRLTLTLKLDTPELSTTATMMESVDLAYQQRDYYQAWCLLRDFCQSDLQRFFDNLANGVEETQERRYSQATLLEILYVLVQRFAPILPFFSEQTYALIRTRVDTTSPSDCPPSQDESELSSIFLKDWISHTNFPYAADADML